MTDRVDVMGCAVDSVSLVQATDRVANWVNDGATRTGCAFNANKAEQARRPGPVRDQLLSADLCIADGESILLAARLLGQRLPERVTGVDLMGALLVRATEERWRPYLVGGSPDVIDQAVHRLRHSLPSLRLAGYHHGYFTDPEERADRIRHTQPDLLFVALGSPRQEQFLSRWGPHCDARFSMGVGGSLDILAGAQRRAPVWMRDRGIEWAWRVGREPVKRWPRLFDAPRLLARAASRRANPLKRSPGTAAGQPRESRP